MLGLLHTMRRARYRKLVLAAALLGALLLLLPAHAVTLPSEAITGIQGCTENIGKQCYFCAWGRTPKRVGGNITAVSLPVPCMDCTISQRVFWDSLWVLRHAGAVPGSFSLALLPCLQPKTLLPSCYSRDT